MINTDIMKNAGTAFRKFCCKTQTYDFCEAEKARRQDKIAGLGLAVNDIFFRILVKKFTRFA